MSDKKDVSVAQEERVAKLFGGRRTPQSGGGKWTKGDVLSENFLVECKTTVSTKTSYSVSKGVLEKANMERMEMGKDFYALAFTFGDEKDFFVLDKKAMEYLLLCEKEAKLVWGNTV